MSTVCADTPDDRSEVNYRFWSVFAEILTNTAWLEQVQFMSWRTKNRRIVQTLKLCNDVATEESAGTGDENGFSARSGNFCHCRTTTSVRNNRSNKSLALTRARSEEHTGCDLKTALISLSPTKRGFTPIRPRSSSPACR